MRVFKFRWHFLKKQLFGRLPHRFLYRPAIQKLSTLVPINDYVVEIAHHDCVVGFVEQRGLANDLFFGQFALGDVVTNGNVLVGLSLGVKKGNDGGIDPINFPIAGAVF